MKMLIALAALSAGGALAVLAQEQGPPPVLQIGRELIKEGKGAAHEKTEAAFVRAFRKADFPGHYLALSAMSGPNEVWFVEAFPSFEMSAEWQAESEKEPRDHRAHRPAQGRDDCEPGRGDCGPACSPNCSARGRDEPSRPSAGSRAREFLTEKNRGRPEPLLDRGPVNGQDAPVPGCSPRAVPRIGKRRCARRGRCPPAVRAVPLPALLRVALDPPDRRRPRRGA